MQAAKQETFENMLIRIVPHIFAQDSTQLLPSEYLLTDSFDICIELRMCQNCGRLLHRAQPLQYIIRETAVCILMR